MLVYPMPPVVQASSGRCKSTEETGTERARAAAPAAAVIPKEAESTITIIAPIFPIFPRRISIMFSSAILPNGRQ